MMADLLTTTELAHLLGIRTYQLSYAHLQGFLTEPPRVAGRRVYGPAEVEQVRQYAELHGLGGRHRGRPRSSQQMTT